MKTFKEAELSDIKFGLLNDEGRLQRSVFHLSANPNASKRSTPTLDSVTDPRLGCVQPNFACTTCGQPPATCQGHTGVIPLTLPCFTGTFLKFDDMILTCFCYRCSRLLIPESNLKVKAFRKLNVPGDIGFEKAIKVMYNQALKSSRICGSLSSHPLNPIQVLKRQDKNPDLGCGTENPIFWIRQSDVLIRPVFQGIPCEEDSTITKHAPPIVTMEDVYFMLHNTKPEDDQLLGFRSPEAPLSALIQKYFMLTPLLSRPPRSHRSVDDLTQRLEELVRINRSVAQNPRSGNLSLSTLPFYKEQLPSYGTEYFEPPGEDLYTKQDHVPRSNSQPFVPKHLDQFLELQRAVVGFTFAKFIQKRDNIDYARVKACVSDKFAASASGEHRGIMRENVMARRGDQSARAPVSPDTFIPLDYVGVPIFICRSLTTMEIVTNQNYGRLLTTVMRGANYPGANRITRDGQDYELPGFSETLKIGDVVHRHLIKGDWVLINRQPTLHRYSMMALRVWPMTFGCSFRISLLLTTPYGLDYDGDEMNLLVLPDSKAMFEAEILMSPKYNLFRNGALIIQFVQHAVLGAYGLTSIHCWLLRNNAFQLCIASGVPFEPLMDFPFSDGRISGRQFLSLLLGKIFYEGDKQLNKKELNGIFASKIRWSGNGVELLSSWCRLFELFAHNQGTSLSWHDCHVEKTPEIWQELYQMEAKVNHIQLLNTSHTSKVLSNKVQERIAELLEQGRDIVSKFVRIQLNSRRQIPLVDITESGAKGDSSHVIQNGGVLGPQFDHKGKQLKCMTPHVPGKNRNPAEQMGFISTCYAGGLGALACYLANIASREALVDSILMIKRSGYLFRRLCKALEDCVISFDNSVRTETGALILSSFGFDTTHLRLVKVRSIEMSPSEIQTHFYYPHGALAQREVESLLLIRARVLCSKSLHRQVALPIDWNMLKHVVKTGSMEKEENIDLGPLADLIRVTVTRAWCRMVQEFFFPPNDLIQLSWQENMSAVNLIDYVKVKTVQDLSDIVAFALEQLLSGLSETGTPIGPIVAEDFCAPVSQMSLKSFHHAGEASQLAGGLDRIEEILTLVSMIATPSMRLYPKREDFDATTLIQIRLIDLVQGWLDHPLDEKGDDAQWFKSSSSVCCCCFHLKKDIMIQREVGPSALKTFLLDELKEAGLDIKQDVTTILSTSKMEDSLWWVCLYMSYDNASLFVDKKKRTSVYVNQGSQLAAKIYYKMISSNRLLAGVPNILDFYEIIESVNTANVDGIFQKKKYRVIVTRGTNFYAFNSTDSKWSHEFYTHLNKSNDIVGEVYNTYGIDAACKTIEDELVHVMLTSAASVSRAHIRLIAAFMCVTGTPRPITFSGLTAAGANKLKMCAYERVLKGFIEVGVDAHENNLNATAPSIMGGKRFSVGTGSVHLRFNKEQEPLVEQPPIQAISEFPKPPLEHVQNIEISLSNAIQDHIRRGGQEEFPRVLPPLTPVHPSKRIIIPKKKETQTKKVPKVEKTKKRPLEVNSAPRRKWKNQITRERRKQTKKKSQKIQEDVENPTWHYEPVFVPAKSPPRLE